MKHYTKEDIQELIVWLDRHAEIFSNTNKPREDNNFGRAAQALHNLIEHWVR